MMKTNLIYLIISLLLISCTVREKLLIGGCNWDKVAIVDKKTNSIEWIHQLQKGDDCNDVEITKAGNILYAYKGGARLVTKAQKVLWDFKVEKGQELYTATELPSGDFFLAACGVPSRLITLNQKGEKTVEQNFDSGIANVHGQFRQILPTDHNSYLIPLMGKGEVIELTKTGEVTKRIKVGGNPFSVKVMQDGNWLVACGDAHKLVVVNPDKQLVKDSIPANNVKEAALLFVAEPVQYRNGNIVIANWNGHSKDKTQPKLVEIDAKNKVVWTLSPSEQIANISAVYPFKAKK
ncbi:MAG: hypothetical protein WCP85_18180 [Mariniphaga sp.]